MKLIAKNGIYTSPKTDQGTFDNAFIEDIATIHRRNDNYLAVTFGLNYEVEGKVATIAKAQLVFFGLDSEINIKGKTSNRTSLVDIPNPDYDASFVPGANASSEEIERKTMQYKRFVLVEYLSQNNGVLPEGAIVVSYGFPTYEKVKQFFTGGEINAPELNVNNPVARGFLLENLIINGEPASKQFEFEN